jgi:hypothetical protein
MLWNLIGVPLRHPANGDAALKDSQGLAAKRDWP